MPPTRILPWWPHILFGFIEPAALLAGTHLTLTDPQRYLTSQVPPAHQTRSSSLHVPIDAATSSLVYQWGNIMLLLAALAVFACFFSGTRTVRGYLLMLMVADWGHIYATYLGIGATAFLDVANWNDMLWGGVGFSAFLNINRVATLAGVFGPWQADTEHLKKA